MQCWVRPLDHIRWFSAVRTRNDHPRGAGLGVSETPLSETPLSETPLSETPLSATLHRNKKRSPPDAIIRAVSTNIRRPAFLEEAGKPHQLDSSSSLISAKQWTSASDAGTRSVAQFSFSVEILPHTSSFGDWKQSLQPAGTLLT
jgi:hypothetical protein